MKKFYFLLLSFLALSLCANAEKKNVTLGRDWNTLFGTSYAGQISNVKANTLSLIGTADGVSIDVKNGTSTNGYVKTGDFRAYNGYTITLSTSAGKITSITSTVGAGGKKFANNAVKADVGTLSISSGAINWSGSSKSVALSISGTGSFATITVTYDDTPVAVEVPVIEETSTPNQDGKYYTTKTATAKITCETEGATIQYAITGDDVTDANTIASWTKVPEDSKVSFTSSDPATKILWAKAVKDGNKSSVVSKEFTFIKEPVSLKYELVVDESQIVAGAKYIIADSKGDAVMGTTLDTKNGYYNAIESDFFTISGNMLSISETAGFASIEFEAVPEPVGDKIWFVKYNNGNGYTYLKGKADKFTTSTTGEDAASISIEADNTVKMIFASNTDGYYLKYNVGSPRFKPYTSTNNINFISLYRVYEEPAAATSTGLDAVLVGDAGKKYQINTPLRVNYKDDNYVYASTIGGGSTKTSPTDAQKKEWWSDDENKFKFTQNDWVAIQGLDVEIGKEIAGGSTVVLCKNAAFPVVKFVSEVTLSPTTEGAIDANTFRVANFVDSDNELVKKLWLVDPQPAEHCFVKGYVASLEDVLVDADAGVGLAEIKSGEKDVVTMYVNYKTTDFSITATGWYRFEGVVVNGTSGLELNAVKMNEGTATGVEGVETSSVKVYGAEGVINVESEEVAPIAVYSANGAIVSSVEASSASIAVAPGFYIVKAGNSVSKVTVK